MELKYPGSDDPPAIKSAGVKTAFHARCLRQPPKELWICDEVEFRRYLQLDSQKFEVRLSVPLRIEEAFALIEATRLEERLLSAITAVRSIPTAEIDSTSLID